jgi:hypothetical protein
MKAHNTEKNMMVSNLKFIYLLANYANEDDGYGDEMEGDDDKNDGMNALVC